MDGSVTIPMRASRTRFLHSLVLCLFLLLGVHYMRQQNVDQRRMLVPRHAIPEYKGVVPRIAKVSMLYGKPNRLYQKAIASHERHAAVHGYPVHILRNQVAKDYWNKPSYLISLLLQELEKDPGDRLEWLMWFDADSVVMNTDLPVEIFLPPNNQENSNFHQKHLLVTKDWNGVNTGIFFIRVHEWSVQFMTKTLTYPLYNPDIDLGPSPDQAAMAMIINETEYRDHTTFIPRVWVNTYVHEVQQGHLLVHFAGLIEREKHMTHWLGVAEGPTRQEWIMPTHRTQYPLAIERFWKRLKSCETMVHDMNNRMNEVDTVPQETRDSVSYLREACWYRSDEFEVLLENKHRAEAAMRPLVVQFANQ